MHIRKENQDKYGVTLIELVAVVIIISILAAMSLPTFFKTRERGLDKVAIATLNLLKAAEIAQFEATGNYWPKTGIIISDLGAINSNLSLYLVADGAWNYRVTGPVLPGIKFGTYAERAAGFWGGSRFWYLTDSMVNATCTGNCL